MEKSYILKKKKRQLVLFDSYINGKCIYWFYLRIRDVADSYVIFNVYIFNIHNQTNKRSV